MDLKAKASIFKRISTGAYQYAYWKYKIDPIYTSINEYIPPEGDILVLGCGMGLEINFLNNERRYMTGVDWDKKRIDTAIKAIGFNNSNIKFIHEDAAKYSYDKKYNGIILIDLLHYFPKKVQERILASIAEHIENNGVLLIRDGERRAGFRYYMTFLFEFLSLKFKFTKANRLEFPNFDKIKAFLESKGFQTDLYKKWGKTFFSNKLLIAVKRG